MEYSKESYRIITAVWHMLKTYIPKMDKATDADFQSLWDESNTIYDSTKDMPDYYREGVSMMIRGAVDILDGLWKERHE